MVAATRSGEQPPGRAFRGRPFLDAVAPFTAVQVVPDLDPLVSEWTKLGVSVLAFDYRGYGWRAGAAPPLCPRPSASSPPAPRRDATIC